MLNIRILVVDDHGTLRKRIADYLRAQEGVEEVAEAANGVEALKCLRESRFDVMITDLVMPLMDGYMLLEELPRQIDPPPKTIVMSALSRDDFVTRAIDLGAVFYMVKPFEPEHLLSHIRDIQEERSALPQAQAPVKPHVQSLDERLGSLFLTIGIPAHIKGYQFLRCGVKMVIEQPDRINRITKELYPGIARKFDTTASKVERAMRHAIDVAWSRGRLDAVNSMYGYKVLSADDKPTNGEFIALIADKVSVKKSA